MKQHPDDLAVDKFADAMKEKLAQARAKGRGGWEECAPADLSAMLHEHVAKGDPRDVANFCMFLWTLGQPITPYQPAHVTEPLFLVSQRTPFFAELWQAVGNDVEVVAHVYGKHQQEIERRVQLLNYLNPQPEPLLRLTDEQIIAKAEFVRDKQEDEAEFLIDFAHAIMNAMQAKAQPAPDAEDLKNQFEFIDRQNHQLRTTLQKIMAKLADLLDEDQYAHIECLVLKAGVEPPKPASDVRELVDVLRNAKQTARLMHDENGHEVVCIEPQHWAALAKHGGIL